MEDLDTLLMLLENPTRRRILSRLTTEAHYPLQLAKELKLSPQAVMKHLDVLEKYGFVRCTKEESNMGPARKCYVATKRLWVRLDVAPNLFEARFQEIPIPQHVESEPSLQDLGIEQLKEIHSRIKELNRRLSQLERAMSDLMVLKEKELHKARSIIRTLSDSYEEREVMHYVVSHDNFTLNEVSEALGMREELVRGILSKLEDIGLIEKEVD